MKAAGALRTNRLTHPKRSKKVRHPSKYSVNIVWVLLWVFFLIGLMLAIGIFYAAIHLGSGMNGAIQ